MFGYRRVFSTRPRSLATQVPSASRSRLQVPRHASTASVSQTPAASSEQPSRWPRRLIYAGVFGGLGLGVGTMINEKVATPPEPDTEEDLAALEDIKRVYENGLPLVKRLRENPDYVETGVYGNFSEESKKYRITSGPLRGSRGLAFQRVFWNDKEKKAVSIVFLGPGLEGWPGMVHGGALATVIDENLGRVAIRHLPERTGVTANMQINYRAPVFSGNFYSFHAAIDTERTTERKAYATVEVRDPTGKLCAEGSGLFVVPKQYQLRKVGDRF